MATTDKVKLNLGSRDRNLAGFTNIDIDAHPGVDIVCDVSDLKDFKNESVDEIYASHILEHFQHPKTLSVLKEWNRVLVKGGILYVAVPDFKRAVELYQALGMQDWIVNYLWGDQGYKTAFHYAGFDLDRLRDLLLDAGFSEASQVDVFPYKSTDCSNNVSTCDGKNVSLNVLAVK